MNKLPSLQTWLCLTLSCVCLSSLAENDSSSGCSSEAINTIEQTSIGRQELLFGDSGNSADHVTASAFIQKAKLTATGGALGDEFGYATALSADGNTVLIGAPYTDNGIQTNQGAAYVFTRSGNTWIQQAKLNANDGAAFNWFGFSAALSSNGNTAVIGAVGAKTNQGAGYIFTRYGSGWTQTAKLMADDGVAYDWLGYSVALSTNGDTVVLGAHMHGNLNQGAAYVFTRSGGWAQQAKLIASDGAANNSFGHAVALSADGNTTLIGAHMNGHLKQGAAYVFTRSGGWIQQAKLTAANGAASDYFGWAVALNSSGNTALIGAYPAIVGGDMQGAAYVFTRSGSVWNQQATLAAADGASWDDFGYAVALSGDGNTALIGAIDADVAGKADQGAAYVFKRSGSNWSEQGKLAASDGAAYDYFGCSLALSSVGDTAVIGAYYPASGWNNKNGAGYIFALTDLPPVGPIIKANGTATRLSINSRTPLSITVAMNQGDLPSVQVDWWIITRAGSAWYYLNNSVQWTPFDGNLSNCRPVHQGGLVDLPATEVLQRNSFPPGSYTFYFAIDYPSDGILNPSGPILVNSVGVTVTP